MDTDFHFIELEFEQSGNRVIMHLNGSLLGNLHESFKPPFSDEELSAKLDAIEDNKLKKPDLAAFGQQLYKALAPRRVAEAIEMARQEARRSNQQVILRLRFDEQSASLAAIPWELIHDGRNFPVAIGAVEITRSIGTPFDVPPVEVAEGLQVLQVIASPVDQPPPIDVKKTRESLDRVPNLSVERLDRSTYEQLQERVVEEPRLHVLHFDGHGALMDGQNLLYFENKSGLSDPVNAEELQQALYNQVDLVLLSACQSTKIGPDSSYSFVSRLIANDVPAVVGMQFDLRDHAAARFVEAFYGAIAEFKSLTKAMSAARRKLFRKGKWYVPTLYLNSIDPVGQLFLRKAGPNGYNKPNEDEQHLRDLLARHQHNRRQLLMQKSYYGAGEVPLRLLNQIAAEEKTIRDIEQQLRQ